MSEIVDLDALIPPTVTLKFDGQTITIQPPKTSHILRLGALGRKLVAADELSDAEVEKLVDDLKAVIYQVVPELTGKDLTTGQLTTLMYALNDASMPPDTKELDKRGISTGDPKAP